MPNTHLTYDEEFRRNAVELLLQSNRPLKRVAHAMATLRNLALGLFELQTDRGKANAPDMPGWRRKMTASVALRLLTKGV